jgi:hypothetical protein
LQSLLAELAVLEAQSQTQGTAATASPGTLPLSSGPLSTSACPVLP